MYKIVTFRSRQLKYTDYICDEYSFELDEDSMYPPLEEDEDGTDRKLTRKERKAQKRKIKEAKKKAKKKEHYDEDNVKTYIINGEEVAVEDLTAVERAMIRADEELNKDGFYDGLEPFDNDETEVFVKTSHRKLFVLLAVIAIVVIGYSFYQLATGRVSF